MASELFITELECLAYFNHSVTFPFLNCVEQSEQDDLVEILPKLHTDLLNCNTETLKEFRVDIHGFTKPTLSSETSEEIVKSMCISAADAILVLCGREYGFSDEPLRATDISQLTQSQREGLPTNNCISERDLSKFDKEATVARCRNRKFTAKNIRNNMVLYKCKEPFNIDGLSKKITATLLGMESEWNKQQKSKLKVIFNKRLKFCFLCISNAMKAFYCFFISKLTLLPLAMF